MKLALVHRDQYPEVIARELDQLTRAIASGFDRDHDAEGRQRRCWAQMELPLGNDQTIANNTATRVVWRFVARKGIESGISLSADSTGLVTLSRVGLYHVSVQARWASNGTGYRRMDVLDAAQLRLGLDTRMAVTGVQTVHQVVAAIEVTDKPQVFSVWVTQTSGGNLALEAGLSDTWLLVTRVA